MQHSSELTELDRQFLDVAYEEARQGLKEGGIPIGAVLVHENKIIAKGHNKRIQEKSMIKHGEMDCFENTKREVPAATLQHSTLYSTLSPCYMCAGTSLLFGIKKVVIGENITFEQSEMFLQSKGTEVLVANDEKFISLMANFIMNHPKLWGEDIGLTKNQVLEKYQYLESHLRNSDSK